MAEPETLRLLLQNKFDRIENLVQMNHAATLAVPSVLAATWGISLQERGNGAIPILCIISISLLLVWRYFAHYLDDDITSTYCQIIKLEQILGVLPAVSLYQKIFFDIWIFQDWTRSRKDKKSSFIKKIRLFLRRTCDDELTDIKNKLSILRSFRQQKIVKELVRNKSVGYRGHEKWDALSFIVIFVCIESFFFTSKNSFIALDQMEILTSNYIAFTIIGSLIIWFVLWIIFQLMIQISREPTIIELKKIT